MAPTGESSALARVAQPAVQARIAFSSTIAMPADSS
jgi:hypothetical protein